MKKCRQLLWLPLLVFVMIGCAQAQNLERVEGRIARLYPPVLDKMEPEIDFFLDIHTQECPNGRLFRAIFDNVEEAKATYALLLTAVSTNRKVILAADTSEISECLTRSRSISISQ